MDHNPAKDVAQAPRTLPGRVVLCKNAFHLLPWPFRQQVSKSCSSFLSLKRSYHPFLCEGPRLKSPWLLQDMFLLCPRWNKVHLGVYFPRFPPTTGCSAPGAVEYVPRLVSAPQSSSTRRRPLSICSEYLTVCLDIKVVNYTHHYLEKNHQLASLHNLWEGAWAEDAEMNRMPTVKIIFLIQMAQMKLFSQTPHYSY